jgi:ABC-type antimicrobial peptide transport system permease subunit
MLKHNLIVIFRNIRHNKSSFFINLIGLSTGLICVLLIFLWVNDELSVDKFPANDRQLFQVMQNAENENGIATMEATPGHLAEALAKDMPEVKYATTVIPTSFNVSKGIISLSDKNIRSEAQYVTKDFFNVFPYKMLLGNPGEALSAKNKVVISDELALKLFGNLENALGKTINWNAQDISGSYTVTGIFETPASNMTNRFDILLNSGLFEEVNPWGGWGNSSARTYVILNDNVSPSVFNQKIRDFIKSKDADLNITLFAQRYSDRYLHGYYENGKPAGGRIEYVRLFSLVAFFILIIACINFMNLSTAKAMGRIKEVGIKKTIGAAKKNLIAQYMSESMVMTFISLGLALLVVRFLLVPFNGLTGKHLSLSFDLNQITIILGTTVLTGFLAGSYPALYLSRFAPIDILKGKLKASTGEGRARKGLVIFQFAASVILIISVWVVFEQLSFIQSRNLGYNRDHVVYFSADKMSQEKLSEIRNIPGVVNAAGGNLKAGYQLGGTSGINWEGKNPDDNTFFSVKWVGYNLIETLNMKMAEGRAFSEDFNSPNQVIFNETAIKQMGLKNPVGQKVSAEGEEMTIVGVVKDFNFESLYEKVKPCALFVAPVQYAPTVSVRIKAGAEKATLKNLEKVYTELYPGQTFEYRYMDDDYQQLYSAEQRVSVISKYFAAIAILISCLGLFGLAAFTAQQRTKEIGIRKVMGSGTAEIVKLLSADFTRLVVIAIVISIPIGYIIIHRWLGNFAYRIELHWWYFAGAGVVTLLITWFTVGMQTVKAALINPVECLKEE